MTIVKVYGIDHFTGCVYSRLKYFKFEILARIYCRCKRNTEIVE